MKKNKFVVILTIGILLLNLTTSLAAGFGLSKEEAIKENKKLEKDITKEVKSVISKYKYRENEFEVKKCFVFGGDNKTETNRTVIMEVCSSKKFDEDDVLTIYTNILKEVKKFNKDSKVDVYKVGVWFVDACTGKTNYKWIIEDDDLDDLENINFWIEKNAKEDVYRLLF